MILYLEKLHCAHLFCVGGASVYMRNLFLDPSWILKTADKETWCFATETLWALESLPSLHNALKGINNYLKGIKMSLQVS